MTPEREKFLKFNNWGGKLPDDHYPPISGEPKIRSGWFREVVDRNDGMDKVIGVGHKHPQGHSEFYLSQTYREFFLKIDRLIGETGIKEIYDKYLEIVWNTDLSWQTEIWKPELERITEPVIKRMLEMGYTEYDLGS